MAAIVETTVQLLGQHLHTLLLLYWGLASFASTVALLPLPGVDWFRSAVALAACRGKLLDDAAAPRAALGRLSTWTVPQAWFAHFYALGAAWNAAVAWLLLGSGYYAGLAPAQQAGAAAALALLQLHLGRRLAETLGLLRYPPGARMHGLAYVFGMCYYLLVPLSVLPPSAYPPLLEAAAHPGALLAAPAPRPPALSWVLARLAPLQLAGAALFLAGNLLQAHSHWLLARLGRGRRPGYKIPRGGAFELVSCPHYLGEVAIYAGLALAVTGGGPRTPGAPRALPWLMLAWVASNLGLAARMTHAWYHRRFRSYPRGRRALVPWLC